MKLVFGMFFQAKTDVFLKRWYNDHRQLINNKGKLLN